MLIKLIPPSPQPTILFNLTYPTTPTSLALPPAYQSLLHTLSTSSPPLDLPNSLHELDKATYLVALLQEVIFDMGSESVRCMWNDGAVEEWPLLGGDGKRRNGCLRMLERVLGDVEMSAVEGEKERLREEWERFECAQAQQHAQAHAQAQAQAQAQANVISPAKAIRHKKQRSLLMSLVASLVPTSLPLPTLSLQSPPPPQQISLPNLPPTPVLTPPSAPPPPPPTLPPHQHLTSRHLRRRARSTLVDACRRYVLSELSARAATPHSSSLSGPLSNSNSGVGGYHAWIIRSMLRRSEAYMAFLVQENGGIVPDIEYARSRSRAAFGYGYGYGYDGRYGDGEGVLSSPFYEDEEESLSTDTDGSSVHTPSESCVPYPPPDSTKTPSSDPPTHTQTCLAPTLPRSPSPPSPSPSPTNTFIASPTTPPPPPHQFSPSDLQTYKSLSTHTLRLRHLLTRTDLLSARLKAEERALMDRLEVKARRRAWGNGVYLVGKAGGAAGSEKGVGAGGPRGEFVGLGMPFKSSPLRWGCVRAGDVQVELEVEGQGQVEVELELGEGMQVNDCAGFVAGMDRMRISDVPSLSLSLPLSLSLSHSRTRLFPVSEEEEAEIEEYEGVLESGSLGPGPPDAGRVAAGEEAESFVTGLDFGLPPTRTRTRTQSMHQLRAFEGGVESAPPPLNILIPQPMPQPLLAPLPLLLPIPMSSPSPQRPALTRTTQQTILPLSLPPIPESLFDTSPPPYNADEERRIRERRLSEYDRDCPSSPSAVADQDDSSSSDESTLASSASDSSEFTLALDSPGPFKGHRGSSLYGSDEWLPGVMVDCQ